MPDDPRPLTDQDLPAMREEDTQVRFARSQVISIRLSDVELRKLAVEAGKARITVGTFIKRAALDAADTATYSRGHHVVFGFATGSGWAAHGTVAHRPDVGGSVNTTVSGVPEPVTTGAV